MTDGAAIDQSGMNRLVQQANAHPEFSLRYRIEQPLGVGGSGVVFSALQLGIDRVVAVKFLVKLETDDLLRFRREARLLATLRHAHVVALYELGELEQYPYLVTEFLPGGSLRDRLRSSARITLADAVRIGLDSLSGLVACHEAGFVHRDIKPANILFDAEGRAKISDLGLARHDDDAGMTRTGSLVGTPRYMSPEQVRGDRAVVGSDIYAMGLVLYELLAGRQTFIADTLPGLLHMQLEREPDPIDDVAPSVPSGIARAVHRALAKRIEDRPATAQQLYDDIRAAAASAALDVSHGAVALLDTLSRSHPTGISAPAPEPGQPPAAALQTGSNKAQPATSTRARKTGLSLSAEAEATAKSRRTGPMPAAGESTQTHQRKTRAARALERSSRRTSLALIVAVAMISGLVSGVIVLFLTRSGPGDRALAGVPQVRAGATSVRFSWQTRVPSKSGVLVWSEGRGQSEGQTISAGTEERAALDHAVVAANLKPATAYRFRLVYEDGSLSPDSFAFSTRADSDLISSPTARAISSTHARVTWKHRAPVTPGVRVVGRKPEQVYWPPATQPDSVDVPLEDAAMNKLEICFREFEHPAPATGTPERVPLPPVPGPAAARRLILSAMEQVRDNDIRNCCRELLGIPYKIVPSIKRSQVRPGEELVRSYKTSQHDQVIDEVRHAGRLWVLRRISQVAEANERPATESDLETLFASAAAWLADASRPLPDREALREALTRLSALDAAGQLTAGMDILGIDELVVSRVQVDRRPGMSSHATGESLLESLGLTSVLPLPVPVGTWGTEQLNWMTSTMEVKGGLLNHVQETSAKLSVPDPRGPGVSTRSWYRLAPLSQFLHPSAGLHITVKVTNMDPSLLLTLRIGNRNLILRNTLAAYTGYVDLNGILARESLAKHASTLTVQVQPGVLSDDDRAVHLFLDAFAAENTQGTFATPPICWFHDISAQP